MKIFRYVPVIFVGGCLIACGGSKPATAVNPSTVPALEVNAAPVVPDLTPVPEPVQTQEQKVFLDNAVDRYSYALGVDFGRALSNINVPIKFEVLVDAMRDVLDSSREVLMTDSQSEAALQDLLSQMQMQKDIDEAAASRKALSDQAAFLAKNIQDPRVWVTKKGVQYVILKEGTGNKPRATDKVKVHYVGTLLNGTEFDNSVKRGAPLEFAVSAVIEGWQDLLLEMKVGEKVKAWIPSSLAYGEAGAPPSIPPNSLLVFEVELLQIVTSR
ncbi:FKBP-type peptidyl-prolyl cis-trans isomerase [Fibrobacter sp. UWB12]|uniref:FKBP-type peptidyl-prolyl cis-trans isomerase n=1 Tax=Fibrobacter sp. UWB12 TaxID=1896203 RepID=UPI000913D46B|nr:FKBP-type peptidyl-prolyl cis-trans isomerase [Fibrobacter sp. UWB12]SHL01585.1 FKBP-type peptidyl-prolyl cis-trans isomerase FkpA/FKBP-type peptidyl-prolyl cis-trans isomerase FklB [Fibrobacter sp. UWB12]